MLRMMALFSEVLFCLIIIPVYVQSFCFYDGMYCDLADGTRGYCNGGVCTRLSVGVRNDLRVTIKVKYPESTLQAHKGTDLFIRGNALGLMWSRGLKMNKTGSDTWQIRLTYQSAEDGYRCQFCADNTSFTGSHVQYRIFVDDTVDMIGGNLQFKMPVSRSSEYFHHSPEILAYPWFFSKKGTATAIPMESTEIGRNVSVILSTPPSFYENTYKRYPTILTFDFAMETYKFRADIVTKPIVDLGTIGEYIAVGFGDYVNMDERDVLLTQVTGTNFVCINGTFSDNCGHCIPSGINFTELNSYRDSCAKMVTTGGKGNDTLDFLINKAIPEAKQFTNNRMLTDQPNLGVMGMSLGGLMACHAAWTRPNTFGYAACGSPSFWWPREADGSFGFFFNNVSMKDPALRRNRPFQKIYLDIGGSELSDMVQSMLETAEDLASLDAFVWDRNLWASVFTGYPHTMAHWIMRLWKPLKIFFPTTPAPRYMYSSDYKGLPDRSHRGPLCFNCNGTSRVEECHTLTVCAPHQVCKVEDDGVVFNRGCEDKAACVIRSAAQSKRSGAPCHTCCEDDFCNANCTSVPMTGIIIGEFMASVKMAVVHQTNVIMAQPMPMAVGNPKLMGSVHGVREWSSGLCGCMSDCMSVFKTCCCISCVMCELATRTGECFLMPWCVPNGVMTLRTSIRRLGGIRGSICKDYMAMIFCQPLAICQMLHELDEMGL